MSKTLIMPKIGVNMTEAYIAKWVVGEGDYIEEGQHILDAETDKAIQEIFSTMSGVIAKIVAAEGETVEILKPIAVLVEKGESLSVADEVSIPPEPEPEVIKTPEAKISAAVTVAPVMSGRVKISPLAKKIAKEMGIDYTFVKPKIEGERICKNDVLKSAEQKAVQDDKTNQTGNLSSVVPLMLSADVTKLLQWQENLKSKGKEVDVPYFIRLAVSCALEKFPLGDERTVPIYDLSVYETEYFVPVINPPEHCVLGVGAAIKKPVGLPDGENIAVRTMMSMTLCIDSLMVNIDSAAQFLQNLKCLIEEPVYLVIMGR